MDPPPVRIQINPPSQPPSAIALVRSLDAKNISSDSRPDTLAIHIALMGSTKNRRICAFGIDRPKITNMASSAAVTPVNGAPAEIGLIAPIKSRTVTTKMARVTEKTMERLKRLLPSSCSTGPIKKKRNSQSKKASSTPPFRKREVKGCHGLQCPLAKLHSFRLFIPE